MSISVNIEKKLGDFQLKAAFEAGDETMALLGASGCGKSMTLKCIAGIEKPDRGRIVLNDTVLYDSEKGINLSPQERHVGLLFQNYALFPNMTVFQNISTGAKKEKNRSRRDVKVQNMIQRFDLEEAASLYPHQLSGGQQQRVALARMLISEPQILLLDEPFSALDSHLRFRLEQEVRSAIQFFGKTVLLVSHDRDEVFRMADSIAVMNAGRIESCGEKHAVFAAPKTRMGAMLTGCKNISALRKLSENRIYADDWGVELTVRDKILHASYVGIRMHDVQVIQAEQKDTDHSLENRILCRVTEEIENPFSYTIMLRCINAEAGSLIGWETDKATWKQIRKEELEICLPADRLILLNDPEKTEK